MFIMFNFLCIVYRETGTKLRTSLRTVQTGSWMR